jgi:putative ABC transport system ATP-binding protein
MPNVAIQAKGLTKWFGEGQAKTTALREVELKAVFGEMVYIVEPSGSGKTTLLSVLSGILKPNSGSVSVEGVDIWSLSADQLAEFRLQKIGFVFQDFHLFPRLNTAENVAIPLILRKKDWDEPVRDAHKYLDIVGLTGRADILPIKLSGGEQQRVADQGANHEQSWRSSP